MLLAILLVAVVLLLGESSRAMLASARLSCFISCNSHSTTYSVLFAITDFSFCYASPYLWNQIPVSHCQPHPTSNLSLLLPSFLFFSVKSLLSLSIAPSLFHSQIKTFPQVISIIDYFSFLRNDYMVFLQLPYL